MPLVVAVVAVATYARTLGFALVWDDPKLLGVLGERLAGGGLAGLLAADFRLDPAVPLGFYRPVTMLSLWLDRAAGGGAAWPFHLTNVLLHALASALLFRLLRRLGIEARLALAAAALFAAHPVHVESVAFVSGRTDMLAANFVLGAVLLWLRDRGQGREAGLGRVAGGSALFALGCLSKEVALVLPAVLVAWDALLPAAAPAWRARRRAAWLVGFGAALALVLLLRGAVAGVPLLGAGAGAHSIPLGERLLGAPAVLIFALRLLVLPWPLSPYHTPDQLRPDVLTIGAAAVVLAAWTLLAPRRWHRAGLLSAAWTVGFLLPSSGLAAHAGAPFAERFLYLPSAGLPVLALAVLGVRATARARLTATLCAAVAAAAAAGAAVSVAESSIWRDEESLALALVTRSPRYADGFVGLGHVREQQGRLDEAAELLARAIAIDPALEGAHMKLGMVRGRQERWDESIASFRRALELRPDYPDALANLGQTFLRMRRPLDAIPPLERAVALRPGFAAAWVVLGQARGTAGDARGAAEAFERAIALAPGDADAWLGLVVARLRQGRPDLAWQAQRELAALDGTAGERAAAVIRGAGY
jgi:tetratricopeptide (TPR) repeat protein